MFCIICLPGNPSHEPWWRLDKGCQFHDWQNTMKLRETAFPKSVHWKKIIARDVIWAQIRFITTPSVLATLGNDLKVRGKWHSIKVADLGLGPAAAPSKSKARTMEAPSYCCPTAPSIGTSTRLLLMQRTSTRLLLMERPVPGSTLCLGLWTCWDLHDMALVFQTHRCDCVLAKVLHIAPPSTKC